MVRRFLASRRTGFYLAVTREGEVGAGDEIKEISRDENKVSIADIVRLYVSKKYSERGRGSGSARDAGGGFSGELEGSTLQNVLAR